MPDVHGLQEQKGAPAHDALDTEALALAHRRLGDTPRSERPVEPDATHAATAANPDDLDRHVRAGGHHDPIELTWNRSDVRVAVGALDLRRMGVDRDDVIADIPEASVDGVSGVLSGRA
jgi:hypothetical protein